MSESAKSQAWSFTINNHTDADKEQLREMAKTVKLMVVNEEVGASGTPHLQGCVIFKTQMRLAAVKTALSDRAHVEPTKAEAASAVYCTKLGGTSVVCVDNRTQGKRSDLEDIREAAAARMPAGEFARKKARGLQAVLAYPKVYAMIHLPKARRDTNKVTWLWGATGSGKTYRVHNAHKAEDIYVKPPGKWWDGYRGEPVILMDAFCPTWFEFDQLLRILDKYPMQVEFKGGSCYLQPATYYITALCKPEDLFKGKSDEDIRRLTLRIHEVVEVTPE
jgi:hypothetical protein